jgi:hypothetical protein
LWAYKLYTLLPTFKITIMKTTLEKYYTHDKIAKEFSKLTQVKQFEAYPN